MIEFNNRILILTLSLLLTFALFARFDSITKKFDWTFDEGVYVELGKMFVEGEGGYSLSHFYERLVKGGQRAPEYLKAPLFMHPPLYPFLVSISMRVFGPTLRAGEMVSLIFGVGTIVLIYFISLNAFKDRRKALLSAVFLSFCPVHWLCTKKVWIETTYVFFLYLGVLLLILSDNKNKIYLIASGLSFGLSCVSKHFAVIAYSGILFYMIIRPDSEKPKKYGYIFISLPIIILLPWFLANYFVYGPYNFVLNYIRHQFSDPARFEYTYLLYTRYAVLAGIGFIMFNTIFLLKVHYADHIRKVGERCGEIINNGIFKKFLKTIAIVFVFLLMNEALNIKALSFSYDPKVFQKMGYFTGQSMGFYLRRLPELFPIYYFSIISILYIRDWNKYNVMLLFVSAPIIVFFSFYRNYESRYVLAAIPSLLMLASDTIVKIYDTLRIVNAGKLKYLKYLFIILCLYFIVKTIRFNFTFISPDIVRYLL